MFMILVECFDGSVSRGVILRELLQDTCDKVGNSLAGLLFVVAVDARYRNVLVVEVCLEMVYDD
jgi:hypothetical protein